MAIGRMGVASHGMNFANGAGRVLQGGATMGANAARSMGWGGTAGQLSGLAAMSGGGMAALVGLPAAATAAAFYLAPGGFRDTWAEQDRQDKIGTGLDRRQAAFWNQRTRRTMAGIADISYVAAGISSDASADYSRFQGGAVTASQLAGENSRRLRALDLNAQKLWTTFEGTHAGDMDAEQKKLTSAKALNDVLQQQRQIIEENKQSRQQELQTQIQQVQAAQRLREAERETAKSIRSSVGRVSETDWRRGMSVARRAQGRGLTARDAEALDGIPGFGGAVDRFFDDRGQNRIDAIPKEFRDADARTGNEMKVLEAKIKQLEASQSSAVKSIGDNAALSAEAWRAVDAKMNYLNNEVTNFLSRQNYGGNRR